MNLCFGVVKTQKVCFFRTQMHFLKTIVCEHLEVFGKKVLMATLCKCFLCLPEFSTSLLIMLNFMKTLKVLIGLK